MAIWAISLVGIGPIFDYIPSGIQKAENGGFLFLVVINAVVAVWAAPAVSASDFTQNAHSFREQALGQTLGLVVAYILFAVAGVCIIAGASIHYGADTERAGYCSALGQPVRLVLCGTGYSDDNYLH